MAKFKRAMIIINPAAGKAEPILSVLNDVFGPAGIDWQVSITHKAGDGAAAARAAAEEGFDLIGAYGGDGTVAEVAWLWSETAHPFWYSPAAQATRLRMTLVSRRVSQRRQRWRQARRARSGAST